MADIAKSLLTGAWTLLIGWIFPTALNVGVFLFAIDPSLRHVHLLSRLRPTTPAGTSLLLLTMSILLGLVLSALQNWLYGILEGYYLWPRKLYSRGCTRRRSAKADLRDRIDIMRLERLKEKPQGLGTDDAERLAEARRNMRITKEVEKDRARTAPQQALLEEKLARYPNDAQIAPTRLGNAIRRLEEFGYDRFRLDSVVLWNELMGAAPDQVRQQVDVARANVDFFIALIYGHIGITVAALASLSSAHADNTVLVATAVVLGLLTPVWYMAAVASTDEWASAVRALVNLGRKPLADSLGLVLPPDLQSERAMWKLVTRQSRRPHVKGAETWDPYRPHAS